MDRSLLKSELIRDEGLRLEAYKDSLGYWTIGIGHYLGTEKRMSRITRAEAEALLEADIEEAVLIVHKLLPPPFLWEFQDYARERVLINMAFNLGPRLGQFKRFLAAVRVRDWYTASLEMQCSKWAKQVGARATRLSNMMTAAPR